MKIINKFFALFLSVTMCALILLQSTPLALAQAEKVSVRPVEPFYNGVVAQASTVIYEDSVTYLSPVKSSPIIFTSLGATWTEITPENTSVIVQIRLKLDDKFTDWVTLEADPDTKLAENAGNKKSSFLTSTKAEAYQYRVYLKTKDNTKTPLFENLEFTFLNGGSSKVKSELMKAVALNAKKANTELEQHEDIPDSIDSDAILGKAVKVKNVMITAEAEKPVTLNPGVVRTPLKINPIKPTTSPASKLITKLPIITRAEWGADESLRLFNSDTTKEPVLVAFEEDYYQKFANELVVAKEVSTNDQGKELTWPLTYPEKISKIVVHHTATTNHLDDPERAIRDIYYWHTISKGWGDIGYNYIIDQQGNIYEGRYGGEMVVGAHAGRGNFGSIGIAVLGNYQDEQVPDAVVQSLTALIKEKTQQYNIDPEGNVEFRGENYDNIMGHRDIGQTSCPGQNLYDLLPAIRKAAKADYKATTAVASVSKDYDFQFAGDPPIVTLDPGAKKTIKLKVKNIGKMTWSKGSAFQVQNNSTTQTFLKNSVSITSSSLGKEVKPGESIEISFTISATSTAGSALIPIYFKKDGTTKIERYLSFPLAVKKAPVKKQYDYELVSVILSKTSYKPGEIVDLTVKIRNTGVSPWQKLGANKTTLGADNPRDHQNQLLLTPSARLDQSMEENFVKSGDTATFKFKIKVPSKSGVYREFFAPVIEGITWLENKNTYFEIKVGSSSEMIVSGVPEATTTNTTEAVKSNGNIAASKLDLSLKPRNIRVDLSYRGNPAVISANGNFALYEGKRKVVSFVADTKVEVKYVNSAFEITSGTQKWTIGSAPKFLPMAGTIMRIDNWERRNTWGDKANNNEFRGTLEVFLYDNELHVLNELGLEDYLKGLAEVGSDAPYEKIKTMMVIARTYARFYQDVAKKFPGAPFDLNDDPDYSQKYIGYSYEKRSPQTVKGVADTGGEYVTYDGRLIKTPYFSKSNGKTISALEKWGWTDAPFLQSVDDSLCVSTAFSGHGVGLSGCGADAMAKAGKTYREIIKYYYRGADITKIKY